MVFLKLQENLSQLIETLEKKYTKTEVFPVYSHIIGDRDNTAEITFILHTKTQESVKNKLKIKDVNKFFNTCVQKKNLPNFEDKMFKKMVNFFTQNRKEYEVPREKLLYLLKRQDAGLSLKKWITQNVLYSFNNLDNPVASIIQNDTEEAYCALICSYDMKEDGLLLMLEDKLAEILQEKYKGTEGIPEKIASDETESIIEKEHPIENVEKTVEKIPNIKDPEEISEDTKESKEVEDTKKSPESQINKKKKPKAKISKKKKVVTKKMGLFGPILTTVKDTEEQENENKPTETKDKEQTPVEEHLTSAEKQKLARKSLAQRRMKRNKK
ncbi:hypothetical protein [Candidatus Lokiarchaeum ossiferum]|uniref:hypothetical protein n=1 Tax=Candidatus Lokiarchaeum ossiferum TaxID=2951803 RepID=UPI00352C1858